MFNMNQCKKGDKLLLRNGEVATYIKKTNRSLLYSHDLMHENSAGLTTSTTDDGYFYGISTPHQFDVIEFVKSNNDNELLIAEVMDQINTDVCNSKAYKFEDIVKNCPTEILKAYLKQKD